jgi:hypothetical protein
MPGDVSGRKGTPGMRKIRSAAAALGAGILASPLALGTAHANTYTISYIDRCAVHIASPPGSDCMQLGTYSTYSNSQVWINGNVFCKGYKGSVKITWCGVGGGNGTGALNIGDNFTFSGTGGLYERMTMFAGGGRCGVWGSNTNTNSLIDWSTGDQVCESPR